MSKNTRSGGDEPPKKKICVELSEKDQQALVVGWIQAGVEPCFEILQRFTLSFLRIENLQSFVIPDWLRHIPSLEHITINHCIHVSATGLSEGSDSNIITILINCCDEVSVGRLFQSSICPKKISLFWCKNIKVNSNDYISPRLQKIVLHDSQCCSWDWLTRAIGLRTIYMKYYGFSSIPSQIAKMPELESVVLTGNEIAELPKVSNMWPKLRKLSIDLKKGLEIERGTFADLPLLEGLKIGTPCYLDDMLTISSLPSLKCLWLFDPGMLVEPTFAENPFPALKILLITVKYLEFPSWILLCKNTEHLFLECRKDPKPVPRGLSNLKKLFEVRLDNISYESFIVDLASMPSVVSLRINNETWERCFK